MMTVPEVASQLRVAVSTVYALVEAGKLGAFRIGPNDGAIRVSDKQLQEYLNACCSQTNTEQPESAPTVT